MRTQVASSSEASMAYLRACDWRAHRMDTPYREVSSPRSMVKVSVSSGRGALSQYDSLSPSDACRAACPTMPVMLGCVSSLACCSGKWNIWMRVGQCCQFQVTTMPDVSVLHTKSIIVACVYLCESPLSKETFRFSDRRRPFVRVRKRYTCIFAIHILRMYTRVDICLM
jgi:hypothetical protein